MNRLDGEQYISLGTFKKNGDEVLTPVWFAADARDPKLLWVYTNVTSWKVKRIKRNGRARVAPCNAVGKVTGSFVAATARMVGADSAKWQRGWDALHAKYWLLTVGLLAARVTGRYAQRGLIALRLEDRGRC